MKLHQFNPQTIAALTEIELRREQLFPPFWEPFEEISVQGAEAKHQAAERERFLKRSININNGIGAFSVYENRLAEAYQKIAEAMRKFNESFRGKNLGRFEIE